MITCWNYFPLLLSPVLSPLLLLPLSSSLLLLLLPPAPKANLSFLSSSQIVFLIKGWQWQGWDCSRMWVLFDRGKGLAIFVYYWPSSQFFIRGFIFHWSLFLIWKPLTWIYIVKWKRLNYSLLAIAKIHEGSKPQLVPGCPKPWHFTLFGFLSFSVNTCYRVCLCSVIWEWLKIHSVLLDKDLCQWRAAQSCEHLSQGPGDLVEPGLKGCFLTVMLPHELRAEASVWGPWPRETMEQPHFNKNYNAGQWACSLIAGVPGQGQSGGSIHTAVMERVSKEHH